MQKSFSKRIKARGGQNNQQYLSFLDSPYCGVDWDAQHPVGHDDMLAIPSTAFVIEIA